jgi:hypothetical protein
MQDDRFSEDPLRIHPQIPQIPQIPLGVLCVSFGSAFLPLSVFIYVHLWLVFGFASVSVGG